MAAKSTGIHVATCKKCGEQVSGPDLTAVNETMARHTAKRHPKAAK